MKTRQNIKERVAKNGYITPGTIGASYMARILEEEYPNVGCLEAGMILRRLFPEASEYTIERAIERFNGGY